MQATESLTSRVLDGVSVERPRAQIPTWEIAHPATADNFFDPDPQFQLKVRINEVKRIFHRKRALKIKYLPTNVTKQEISKLLDIYPIEEISIVSRAGEASGAIVTLADHYAFEEWDKNRKFLLRGHPVSVTATPTENWIVVERIPITATNEDFVKLTEKQAGCIDAFLMFSFHTGSSKGYGFIHFASKNDAINAKRAFHGMTFPGSTQQETLWVENVDPAVMQCEQLHHKTLIVFNLPKSYTNRADFRETMAVEEEPMYCDIVSKNGISLGCGLVEYSTVEGAEAAFEAFTDLNGTKKDRGVINGNRVHVYYSSDRAIHRNFKLISEASSEVVKSNKGQGLLPTPPPPSSIVNTVKSLERQNPVFAQSLQAILAQERLSTSTVVAPTVPPVASDQPTNVAAPANGIDRSDFISKVQVQRQQIVQPPEGPKFQHQIPASHLVDEITLQEANRVRLLSEIQTLNNFHFLPITHGPVDFRALNQDLWSETYKPNASDGIPPVPVQPIINVTIPSVAAAALPLEPNINPDFQLLANDYHLWQHPNDFTPVALVPPSLSPQETGKGRGSREGDGSYPREREELTLPSSQTNPLGESRRDVTQEERDRLLRVAARLDANARGRPSLRRYDEDVNLIRAMAGAAADNIDSWTQDCNSFVLPAALEPGHILSRNKIPGHGKENAAVKGLSEHRQGLMGCKD